MRRRVCHPPPHGTAQTGPALRLPIWLPALFHGAGTGVLWPLPRGGWSALWPGAVGTGGAAGADESVDTTGAAGAPSGLACPGDASVTPGLLVDLPCTAPVPPAATLVFCEAGVDVVPVPAPALGAGTGTGTVGRWVLAPPVPNLDGGDTFKTPAARDEREGVGPGGLTRPREISRCSGVAAGAACAPAPRRPLPPAGAT